MSKLTNYIEDLVSPVGSLAKSKTEATTSISDYTEEQTALDGKIEALTARYMSQFSAMETAVTGFKKDRGVFDRIYRFIKSKRLVLE